MKENMVLNEVVLMEGMNEYLESELTLLVDEKNIYSDVNKVVNKALLSDIYSYKHVSPKYVGEHYSDYEIVTTNLIENDDYIKMESIVLQREIEENKIVSKLVKMDEAIYNKNTNEFLFRDINTIEDLKSMHQYKSILKVTDKHEDLINRYIKFFNITLKHKNIWLYETIKELKEQFIEEQEYYQNINAFINLYILTVKKTDEFEKLLKANPNLVISMFYKDIINLSDGNKLNQITDMPLFVTEYIEKNDLVKSFNDFKNLNLNGNDYKYLLEFLELYRVHESSASKRREYTQYFISSLSELLNNEYHKYDLRSLLSHLVKQNYLNGELSIPYNEAKMMVDYFDISSKINVIPTKYPSIRRDHNIAMKNDNILLNIDKDAFIDSINSYKDLVDKFEDDNYIILVPESIDDMVEEGNQLHHCVASYSQDVIDGYSKIFFLREKDKPEESLVTIELNSNNELNHIRANFNKMPEDELINKVKRWTKKI